MQLLDDKIDIYKPLFRKKIKAIMTINLCIASLFRVDPRLRPGVHEGQHPPQVRRRSSVPLLQRPRRQGGWLRQLREHNDALIGAWERGLDGRVSVRGGRATGPDPARALGGAFFLYTAPRCHV